MSYNILNINIFSLFRRYSTFFSFFFLNDPPTPESSPLPLPDPLPICGRRQLPDRRRPPRPGRPKGPGPAPPRRRLSPSPAGRDLPVAAEKSKAGPRGGSPYCDPCWRSEEHTSELQSQSNIACRLLLAK